MVGVTIAQADTHAHAPGPGLAPGPAPGGIPGLAAVAGDTQVEAPEMDTATPIHHPDVVGMGLAAEAGTWAWCAWGVRDLLVAWVLRSVTPESTGFVGSRPTL